MHLTHEASIKSIGRLYVLSGVLGIFLSLLLPIAEAASLALSVIPVIAVLVAIGGVGVAVVKLKRWARFPATFIAVIGLLGFPFGTLINGYFIWLVWSARGRRIFRADYADIVAATPHIKYRTSKIVLAFVFLLLAAVVFIIAQAMWL